MRMVESEKNASGSNNSSMDDWMKMKDGLYSLNQFPLSEGGDSPLMSKSGRNMYKKVVEGCFDITVWSDWGETELLSDLTFL